MIELVTVIGIAAILAAFAIARINTQGFDTEGFANRAAAMVRYAQKIAISQSRTVFVVISSNTITLRYTTSGGTPLHEPPGTNAFSYSAPSGVAIADATFSFNALGKPSAGTTISVTGDGTKTITVVAETGYVQYGP